MTAPEFLIRCPRCFGLHKWRVAKHEAFTTQRVVAHECPHGMPCIADCAHGRPSSEIHVRLDETVLPDGTVFVSTKVVGCDGKDPCHVDVKPCPECSEARAKFYATPLPRPECLVCREVKRQGGTGCPTLKTRKDGQDTYIIPDPFCKWRKLERMPPWCAGATPEEQQRFLSAIPAEARPKAIEEARKANAQKGAEQRHEKKTVEKKKPNGQTSMF